MRNLKKLLSVVLVVAMIAGLCAVGSFSAAAAEYSEVTNYKEAAAVITGVGVMDGYEDGTMQYDKTVTREEAAAIICRALIGVDTAKKLSTAVAPFADVAANRWSAPYINYLKSQGIVNGKTATQFDPTAEVTAVEFAKMMLCAVGYGKAGEFVGASWDVNTITAANNNGVYTGTLAADLTAPATREQCMLYAFNTMVRVPVVNYNNAFQSYYVGTSITSGLKGKVDEDRIGLTGGEYDYTLAYRNFKLERTDSNNNDAYGRPVVKWTSNGKTISDEICSKTPTYVLNGKVTSSTIYNTLGADVVKNINKQIWNDTVANPDTTQAFLQDADEVLVIYKNGENLTGVNTTAAAPSTAAFSSLAADAFTATITAAFASDSLSKNAVSGNGDIVEIYVDTFTDKDITTDNLGTAKSRVGDYKVRIVVTSEYFGEVTAVSNNKLTVKVYSSKGPYSASGNAIFGYVNNEFEATAKAEDVNISGFAKKDYVLVNVSEPNGAAPKITKISAAKAPVVGTFGGSNSMFQPLIDGAGVNESGVISFKATYKNGTGATPSLISGNQYSFWYDSMGNLIYAKLYEDSASADVSKYVYVKNIRCASTSDNYDKDFEVQLLYSDGKSEWVHYNIDGLTGAFKFNGNTYYAKGTDGSPEPVYNSYTDKACTAGTTSLYNLIPADFYTYVMADNKVVLKNTDPNYALKMGSASTSTATVTFNANTGVTAAAPNTFGNYATNSSTKVSIVDGSGTVINFNGEANFAGPARTGYCLYTFDKDSTKIKNIFFVANAPITTTAKAFYVGTDRTETEYAYVNLYIDGAYVEKAKIEADNAAFITMSGYKVFNVEVAGDLYTLSTPTSLVQMVNNSSAKATDTVSAKAAYGYFDLDRFVMDHYYAWATIDSVDNHAFWTAEADANSKEAGNNGNDAAVSAIKYYFDSSTKIYDCTFAGAGKLVNTVEAGQHFIAMLDDPANLSNSFNDSPNYCVMIWIVD